MEEMKIRNFDDDLKMSNNPKLKESWNDVFVKIFGNDCKIDWKYDKVSQIDFGSDVIITTKKGRHYSADYKNRDFKYYLRNVWLLELVHHIYSDRSRILLLKTKEGWLYKSTSDIIFIGTMNEEKNKIIEVIGFPLGIFKSENFKSKISSIKEKGWGYTEFDNGKFQVTINTLCNFDFLKNNSEKEIFWYKDLKTEEKNEANKIESENKRTETASAKHNLWGFAKQGI